MTAVTTLTQAIDKLDAITKATSEGEQSLLINELYDFDVALVEKILLQVVHVAITLGNVPNQAFMKRYLLHLSSQSLLTGFRLAWMAEAVSPGFKSQGLTQRVFDLRDVIESAAINRHIPTNKSRSTSSSFAGNRNVPTDMSTDSIQQQVCEKEARLALFTHQRAFIAVLTTISAALVKVSDRSKRKAELRKLLEDVNDRYIGRGRVFFPLTASNEPVRWIVNICLSECTVFSSRERAPYLIMFETITDPEVQAIDPSLSKILDPQKEAANGGERSPLTTHANARASPADVPTGPAEVEAAAIMKKVFGESSEEKKARLRAASPYGKHPSWSIDSVMVKAGDDLKQEELALQLIDFFNEIWADAKLTVYVKPYIALSTTPDGGIIQFVSDANSIDGVKKAANVTTIKQFFVTAFGGENSVAYSAAQKNFVETMAGYSVVCYFLQIKDRHNGNLMITREGHLVHIDFGFMLSTSPGGMGFESAPFKLSAELVEVMGGVNSAPFQYFKLLIMQGMLAVRERHKEIIALLELMIPYNSLPCYGPDPRSVVKQVENRFKLELPNEVEYALYVRELVAISVDNWRTRRYDQFQTLQNGII